MIMYHTAMVLQYFYLLCQAHAPGAHRAAVDRRAVVALVVKCIAVLANAALVHIAELVHTAEHILLASQAVAHNIAVNARLPEERHKSGEGRLA